MNRHVITAEDADTILESGVKSIILHRDDVNITDYHIIFNTLAKDNSNSEKEAVEHPKAQVVHAAFHGQVREFVDELRKKFPQGALLLDIHGQASSADTIFRGTQNGTTVMKMVEQHGAVALTGEQSILGYLATKGIKVSPANTPPGTPPETKSFGGGWIVRSYGSHTTNGVDAIQLEFGSSFRTDDQKREETAQFLAEAIKAYTEKYLAPKP